MSISKRLFIAASPRARRIAASSACAYASKNRAVAPAGSSTHAAARSHAGSPANKAPQSITPKSVPSETATFAGWRSPCTHTGGPAHSGAATASAQTAWTSPTASGSMACKNCSKPPVHVDGGRRQRDGPGAQQRADVHLSGRRVRSGAFLRGQPPVAVPRLLTDPAIHAGRASFVDLPVVDAEGPLGGDRANEVDHLGSSATMPAGGPGASPRARSGRAGNRRDGRACPPRDNRGSHSRAGRRRSAHAGRRRPVPGTRPQ